jgi:hypothetical protein
VFGFSKRRGVATRLSRLSVCFQTELNN